MRYISKMIRNKLSVICCFNFECVRKLIGELFIKNEEFLFYVLFLILKFLYILICRDNSIMSICIFIIFVK